MFLDMPEVAEYCQVTAAKDQALLEADAATACQMVVDACGPIELTADIVERTWSSGEYCPLRFAASQIVAVDTLTDLTGVTAVPGGLSGVPAGDAVVTYRAGYAEVPEWAKTAAKAYTKALWQSKIPAKGGGGFDYMKLGDRAIAGHLLGARP